MESYFNKLLLKGPIKLFIIKVAMLIVIVYAMDYSIGSVLDHYYFAQISGHQFRTTQAIDHTTADILIFGSSRANHHYHPTVFGNRSDRSYYNVGRDGNFIYYHYAVLRCVLNRYVPKIIILDFIRGEFAKSQDSYDRLSSLLPYYKNHQEIQAIVELKSPYEKIKLLSSIYPNNSMLFTIIAGNSERNKERMIDIKGYVPMTGQWNRLSVFDTSRFTYEIDNKKEQVYESFIQECIKANIKLYVVCSPYFDKSTRFDPSVVLGQQIAAKYKVQFFDYSNDSAFVGHRQLFADNEHLNDEGAIIFTNTLIDKINTIDHEFMH